MLLRGRSQQELYLGNEILDLARCRGATLFHLTGARSGRHADSWLPDHATDAGHRITDYVPGIADADVYVCGPAAWARNVLEDARAAGVKEDQLHYERFDW